MLKKLLKNKINLMGAALLGLCLTFTSPITTFAKDAEFHITSAEVKTSDSENAMMEKQKEVDKNLFEKHLKEIEKKGFTVTHTAPLKDYVEIGISPFTKENADYIYSIVGKDEIKVVEGQQAQLMENAVTTAAVETKDESKSLSSNSLLYLTIAVAAAGVITLVVRKKKTVK